MNVPEIAGQFSGAMQYAENLHVLIESSPRPAPFAGHLPDLVMPDKLSAIRLTDRLPGVADLPLLDVQICLNRFIQKPGTVSIERFRQGIQCFNFRGIKTKAYSLFFHNT